MKTRDILAVFNRGRISRLAVARTDVSRVALSASIQKNWTPRTLGAMSLRPGLQYHGVVPASGAYIPFVYSSTDTAIIELTAGVMRVWDDGDELVTRDAVSTTVTNDEFTTDLTGWTDEDEAGATSSWSSGALQLVGTGYASAIRRQEVTVSGGDASKMHALRIVVSRGPVLFRIGATAGGDGIFRQSVLRTGTHSISFAPGGNFWIQFESPLTYPVRVSSCEIEAAGVMELPTAYGTGTICRQVRYWQSSDVIFLGCEDLQQRRIERRPNNSWSIVLYEVNDGPFLTENTENILLTPDDITGSITLTASRPVFRSSHVDAIFRLSSQGQLVNLDIAAENTFTNEIRVTGVEGTRSFRVSKGGTWSGTLSLQRSLGEPGTWVTVAEYTTAGSITYNDELDNQIAYYRIGFETGNYTSGTAQCELESMSGSITGVVRITAFTDFKTVTAVVLKQLGGTDPTEIWAEGAWSDVEGWPTAVALSEGRLWWGGNGRLYGSVSDALHSFDPDYVGDAAPINRAAGEGPVAQINWMLPLQRLMVGTDGGERSVRSNSFDEPITPSNYNVKSPSSKGSYDAPAVAADGRGYFIGRDGKTIFELEYDSSRYDFSALEATLLVPEIGETSKFTRLAIQQKPDLRLHALHEDGTVSILVRDPAEDVLCWVDFETDGVVEDMTVLPSTNGDRVFYMVRRTIDGVTYRYHEEWARADQCIGGTLNRQADSFIQGDGIVNGLDHLEGETIVIWGDGEDQGTATVVSGVAVPLQSHTNWIAGLSYEATYKSAKLAGQTGLGLSLTQRTRINKIGLILADTHYQGLQFGPDFDTMDDLPLMEGETETDDREIWTEFDADMIEFPGEWSTDNRVCLKATAPRPCTVLAAVINVDRQDHE